MAFSTPGEMLGAPAGALLLHQKSNCNTIAASLLAFLPCIAADASAEDLLPAKAEINIAAQYVNADDMRLADDDGTGFYVSYARPWKGRLGWEASFTQTIYETGQAAGTDFYQSTLGLDLTYRFTDRQSMRPIAWLGVGATRDDVYPDEGDSTNLYANAALGLQSRPLGGYGLRLRARAIYSYDGMASGLADWRYELGVSIPLGVSRVEERIVYRKVRVEQEPAVVYVDAPDADGDGITDANDECPDSLARSKVDDRGCMQLAQAIQLDGVNFDSGSADLTENAKRILAGTANALVNQQGLSIEIAGHTDSVGTSESNQALSLARANTVRAFLVSHGVTAATLSTAGFGESDPLITENNAGDRARNRRVELRINPGESQ